MSRKCATKYIVIRKPEHQQHHGNLREALILAGLELLEEGGLSALTLRKCAQRAGVTHAAPAHHFDGLGGLKSAIATRGYAIFEQMMREGIETAGTGKRAQLLGACRGYIRFAAEHGALFNLIFAHPDTFPEDPERQSAAASAREVLTDACSHIAHGPAGSGSTEVAVWSLVHGFAKLVEIGRVTPGSGDKQDVKFADILEMLNLEGI